MGYTGHALIEHRAAERKAGDPVTTRALVDAIFDYGRPYPRLPRALEDIVKERLTEAEMRYQTGGSNGVEEQAVVDLINGLCQRLHAPPYALTSLAQVRNLRMRLALDEPRFMGTGISIPGARVGGGGANPSMSPAQALHLTGTLIDQKFLNPEFQVTPTEWEHAKHLVRLRPSGAKGARVGRASPAGPKRREMYDLLSQQISSMQVIDAVELLDKSLGRIGVSMGEGQ